MHSILLVNDEGNVCAFAAELEVAEITEKIQGMSFDFCRDCRVEL